MAEHLDRGAFGEQGSGFFLGARGYFFIEGPSGSQGHAVNARGFDGVAYNIKTDDLLIYDNKTFRSFRYVGAGSAIDPTKNLANNLNNLILRVQNMRDIPSKSRILSLLRQTRSSITSTNIKAPRNVRIAITNFGGNSPGITSTLANRGITFIDMTNSPTIPARPNRTYINSESIRSSATLINNGVAAYNERQARVGAKVMAFAAISQWLNDKALSHAIDVELDRLNESIIESVARGRGVLVVIIIDASSPPGVLGAPIARALNCAYIFTHQTTDKKEAILAWNTWQNQPGLSAVRPPHTQREVLFLWIAFSFEGG